MNDSGLHERSGLVEKLRCPACRGKLFQPDQSKLECLQCAKTYSIVDDVINLVRPETSTSKLEDIDYDEVHGINETAIANIAQQWIAIFDRVGCDTRSVLEIGSGTGALTEGLYRHGRVESLVATDVSLKFLRITQRRIGLVDSRMSFVVCDANELPLEPSSFSAVVGRSILHHLLHYKKTLSRVLDCLEDGGVAIFFEPVLEGKELIAFMAQLALLSDKNSSSPCFTISEANRIRATVRHITKSAWLSAERLPEIEDKYIFSIQDMEKIAYDLGCSGFQFIGQDEVDPSYFKYFRNVMVQVGIPADKIMRFRWIGEAIKETIGLLRGPEMVAPMGYFVFRK